MTETELAADTQISGAVILHWIEIDKLPATKDEIGYLIEAVDWERFAQNWECSVEQARSSTRRFAEMVMARDTAASMRAP